MEDDLDYGPTLFQRYGNEGGVVDVSLYQRYSKEYDFYSCTDATEYNGLEDLPQS
jgi:hypothetical protein